MNAYEILNVRPDANREQVRAGYRALARRWHPDRFMAGPEREWATVKMAEINAAYRECLRGASERPVQNREDDRLRRIEDMIRQGALQDARASLMQISTRSAEWNYLFGAVLYRMSEYRKALTFLSVAVHQNPGNEKYLRAERAARAANVPERGILKSLFRR